MTLRNAAARVGLVLCLAAVAPGAASAQTEDLPPPPPGYKPLVPDLPQKIEDETSIRYPWFSVHFGAAPIWDYTWFSQDDESVAQVGVQENAAQWRSGRIQARGTLFNNRARPWKFLVSFEYRGFDSDPDQTWSWTDWSLTIPAGPVGDVTVGKIKESFAYEMVGDAANLPHLERLLSPFFASRNIGVRLNKALPNERATFAIGAFNDWWANDLDYDDSGWDVSGRVTVLPVWEHEGRRFLHLGGAWRYVGADEGVLRYRGRPESNVADYFVDTGKLPGSHANHWGAEALWNEGPVSVLAEYNVADPSLTGTANPTFTGWYITGSWVVTGEHRPYDRKVGYARRVLPSRHWGAIEVVGRYGVLDMRDQGIDGGVMDKWFTAVNWWATRRWRLSLGYGEAVLDKNGLTGTTGQTLTRIQWVF